ncbi:MAG: hypothetical protein ACRCTZ_22365 [Sarcina sp.]
MKKVILFMSIIVATLNFLGSTKKFDMYNLVRNNYKVIEQGVKIQYIDKAMDKLYLKNNLNLTDDFEMYNDNFYYAKENDEFSIEIKGIDGFVEIEIKNFDNEITVEEIERKTKEMLNKNKDLKVFTYIKGKGNDIYSLNKASSYLEKNFKKKYEKVNLSNGETGVVKIDKNIEYNYSLVSYGKDDNYIIVGSPVIFITY